MWPHRRMEQYISPMREVQEVEMSQGQASPESNQQRAHNDFIGYSDDGIESDDEAFNTSNAPVNLLLFTSIESYAAVQRTTAVRQLTCECTEVLSVRSTEMASTSCIRPNHIIYYPTPLERSSSSDRRIDDQPDEESESHNIPSISDDLLRASLSDDDVSLDSNLSTVGSATMSTEYSHIFPPRAFRRKTFTLNKDLPTPEPSQARRRRLSLKRMAPPSNLATQVANRIIKYARCIRNIHEKDLCCLNCGLFPICPVTGPCGHTRCTKCIEEKSTCPCGNDSPETLFVNILIRDLIGKTRADDQSSRIVSLPSFTPDDNVAGEPACNTIGKDSNQPLSGARGSCFGPIRLKRKSRACIITPYSGCNQRIPMSPRARYNHALELLQAGRHRDAAPFLALAAASCQPDLRPARTLLAQAIMVLSENRDPRGLTRPLNHMVRHLSSTSWIKPTDMECILCCDTFTNPVTTPCGHMFCRTCIERTLDYRKRCPLCLRALEDFNLTQTRDTLFVQAALSSINALNTPQPTEPDLIPIFVCTVAYPSVPCPLFIFDPRYWLMIRRVLESGSRKFGMVTCDRGQNYADYGTILEVRDCVHLEDGRSILSTIGLSRFKVIERSVRDGCEVARILPIKDVVPVEDLDVWELKMLGAQIMFKALMWLNRLNNKVRADIEAAFGRLPPRSGANEEWWYSTDGPTWLWWLVAVLPLRSEIKVLILSTNCLLKRMLAVSRTLEAIDQVTVTATAPSQCELQNSVASNNQPMEG